MASILSFSTVQPLRLELPPPARHRAALRGAIPLDRLECLALLAREPRERAAHPDGGAPLEWLRDDGGRAMRLERDSTGAAAGIVRLQPGE